MTVFVRSDVTGPDDKPGQILLYQHTKVPCFR